MTMLTLFDTETFVQIPSGNRVCRTDDPGRLDRGYRQSLSVRLPVNRTIGRRLVDFK